jgi:hypothetical protein
MDTPKYFIMNPLQIKIFFKKNINEIDNKFNKKLEKLKNINLQNEKIKKRNNLILVSV